MFISLTLPLTKLLNFVYNSKKSLLSSLTSLMIVNKPLTYLLVINFFSLAGLPPLGGFFAKFYIFVTLFEVNMFSILFLFILISCFSAFYYINIIQILMQSNITKPTIQKILPFSFCTILTLLTYIIIFFVFFNNQFVGLDFYNLEIN